MKRLFILSIACFLFASSFAQRVVTHEQPINTVNPYSVLFSPTGSTRTTEIGDTLVLRNHPDSATLVLYSAGTDSGYVTGTDYLDDLGFAEHYYMNGNDSSLMVLGVFAQFGGTVNDTSTQTLTFNIWDQSPMALVFDTVFASGYHGTVAFNAFPGDPLASVQVGATQLGLGATTDTMKLFLFPTPTPVWTSFFAGYNMSYNFTTLAAQNTLFGLACTRDSVAGNDFALSMDTFLYVNEDTLTLTNDTVTDTTENIVINVRNATLGFDNNWYDNRTQNDSLRNHLAIYPIVAVLNPTGTSSITHNHITFFGNFPNPANESTNVKFSLDNSDNVTLQLMDMTGRAINTLTERNLSPGVHQLSINTSSLSPGDYLYLLRTSTGDGMAGKMVVVH